jgi:hypothetical protein
MTLDRITPLLAPTLLALLVGAGCSGDKGDTATTDDTGATGDDTGGDDGSGGDDGGGDDGGGDGGLLDGYDFESAFEPGVSSVSYSGQVLRQLLIDDMKDRIGGLTDRLNDGSLYPVSGDVAAELEFYLDFDSSVGGQVSHSKDVDGQCLQETYDDVSSDKNLTEKLAGNDETGQHKDWSRDFVGWGAPGSTNPEALVRTWIQQIDDQAVDWAGGDAPLGPDGTPVPAVYVTARGQDLQQLLEKFLRGAVAFSQGADDYLDDDTEGKGLLSDHTGPEDGDPFTALEHAWDEGFGYFGAARDYPDWTDDEISDTPALDRDQDGYIDLKTEVNWGHSTNAAKRDRGAVASTDYTADAWEGFYQGRALLSETAGQGLSEGDLATLQGYRDQALEAWEEAIAASVVHYINEVLVDMAAVGTDDYSFGDHAKHWSELKGFALSLQFSRFSPLADDDFEALHGLLGDAPALKAQELDAYADALLQARALIGDAYGFPEENLGDDSGQGGW